MLLAPWSLRYRVSDTALSQLLAGLKRFFGMLTCNVGAAGPAVVQPTHWPSNLQGLINSVALEQPGFVERIISPDPLCGALSAHTVPEAQAEIKNHADPRIKCPAQYCRRPIAHPTEQSPVDHAPLPRDPPLCGKPLFKPDKKRPGSGRLSQMPCSVYPYAGIVRALACLLERPGWEAQCEHWRSRYNSLTNKRKAWEGLQYDVATGWPILEPGNHGPVMCDIYDGQYWEDHQMVNADGFPFRTEPEAELARARARHNRIRAASDDAPRDSPHDPVDPLLQASAGDPVALLAESGVLAVALNVDWWQPNINSSYSVGGVYMTVLNLPPAVRNLAENMLLVAVLPGPKATSRTTLHSVMAPLVAELNDLREGKVSLPTRTAPQGRVVRAFLFNLVMDSDARAPMSGTMKSGAKQQCGWCEQQFAGRPKLESGTEDSARDSSWSGTLASQPGLAPQLAPLRTHDRHCSKAREWSLLPSKEARKVHAQNHGSCYCAVMGVRGFDTIRGCTLDVMHNIFLGVCKATTNSLFEPSTVRSDSEEAADYCEEQSELAAQNQLVADSDRARWKKLFRWKFEFDQLWINAQRDWAWVDRFEHTNPPVASLPSGLTTKERKEQLAIAKAQHAAQVIALQATVDEQKQSIKESMTAYKTSRQKVSTALGNGPLAKQLAKFESLQGLFNTSKLAAQEMAAQTTALAAQPFSTRSRPVHLIVLPALLTHIDGDTLQTMMDQCNAPRDVGRIPVRVGAAKTGFGTLKAAEWGNWAAIFAVPHLTELMRRKKHEGKPFRLRARHLELFMDVQTVAKAMRSYNFTVVKVKQTERLLLKISEAVERLFGAGAVKPNMHWCLHLGAMLLDFGPPAGWSCNGYERFNGLLSDLPQNPCYIESAIMKRSQLMTAVCQYVTVRQQPPAPDAPADPGATAADCDFIATMFRGSSTDPIADTDAAASAVVMHQRTTAAGARQVSYTWRSLEDFRAYQRAVDVVGSEPFPGAFRVGTRISFIGDLFGQRSDRRFKLWSDLVPGGSKHLVNCLQTWYFKAYSAELLPMLTPETARAVQQIKDDARERERKAQDAKAQRAAGRAQHHSNRSAAASAAAQEPEAVPPADVEPFLSVAEGEHIFKLFSSEIVLAPFFEVFHTLDLGGQVFGSRLGGSYANSYVRQFWRQQNTNKWQPFYAQVNFFFRHSFWLPGEADADGAPKKKQVVHSFASVQWFEDAIPVGRDCVSTVSDLPPVYRERLANQNPFFVMGAMSPKSVLDIVPVAALAGRWIPVRRDTPQLKLASVWQALPIPFYSKLHG